MTIDRKGFMARATVGKGTKSIPVQSIAAIQWKAASAMVRGFIQFTVPGGNERRSRFGKQSVDAAKDENSVLFGFTQRSEFERLRDAVQRTISQPGPAHHPEPPRPAAPVGVADELAKLAQLRDSGVISAEEFDVQKRRLLG